MKIIISQNDSLAIYEQIVRQVESAILHKELLPGEALPSIRALASKLEVSVITTKRAYEELEKEKLIHSVAGKGFFVCDSNTEYLRERKYIVLENRMAEVLDDCKKAGMTKEEAKTMVDELWSL